MFDTIRLCGLSLIPCLIEKNFKTAQSQSELESLRTLKLARNRIYASTSILAIAALCLLKTAAKSIANYVCKGLIILSAASDLYSIFRLYQGVKQLQGSSNADAHKHGSDSGSDSDEDLI